MRRVLLLLPLLFVSHCQAVQSSHELPETERDNPGQKDVTQHVIKTADDATVIHTPLVQYITAGCKDSNNGKIIRELLELKYDLQETKTKLQATEERLQETQLTLSKAKNKSGGSTFVRWGRKNCTQNSQLVYSGVAGGSWYDHPGAAANALCLTLSPEWDEEPKPGPSEIALLYGGEYQDIHGHHQHDVPCSVCHVPQSSTIIVPATLTCPSGWTMQYTGHLTAGRYTHKAASEYLCLDRQREDVHNGHENKNGKLFFYTMTRCGTLPCPPYTNDRVVTCVVCSK